MKSSQYSSFFSPLNGASDDYLSTYMMELAVIFVTAAVLLVIYLWFGRPDPRLPPSPMRPFPIVGHLVYMARDSRAQFKEWREKCGDIYSLYMGSSLVVVLNGYDVIKEALVKKGDQFSDRPPYFVDESIGMSNMGVILSKGKIWKEQRSVSLSILREFGMGKNLLAQKIQDEIDCFINYLASLNGKPIDIRVMTHISVANIICSILIGDRFEYDDGVLKEIIRTLISVLSDQQNVSLINFMFWLRYIPGDVFGAKKMEANVRHGMNFFMKFIKEKQRPIETSEEVRNLIDAYIIERNKKIQAGEDTTLDDGNLLRLMMDLFAAGTETVTTTIYWCILYMLNNPEVQEKVYQEINNIIGPDRTPNLQDKSRLPYLNAVIIETQRLASIAPLSVTHMSSDDVTLRGYIIPKGTYIVPSLDSVLHDKTTWGADVMSFRPERFIDDSGALTIPEQFIPYGIGRRVCLGESLAKTELFLYLSSMFQSFQFLPPTPDAVPKIQYKWGIITSPVQYLVKVAKRS